MYNKQVGLGKDGDRNDVDNKWNIDSQSQPTMLRMERHETCPIDASPKHTKAMYHHHLPLLQSPDSRGKKSGDFVEGLSVKSEEWVRLLFHLEAR